MIIWYHKHNIYIFYWKNMVWLNWWSDDNKVESLVNSTLELEKLLKVCEEEVWKNHHLYKELEEMIKENATLLQEFQNAPNQQYLSKCYTNIAKIHANKDYDEMFDQIYD